LLLLLTSKKGWAEPIENSWNTHQNNGYAIVTHNRIDFEKLFTECTSAGKFFAGIIITKHRNVHQLSGDISKFCLTHKNIENQLWYL